MVALYDGNSSTLAFDASWEASLVVNAAALSLNHTWSVLSIESEGMTLPLSIDVEYTYSCGIISDHKLPNDIWEHFYSYLTSLIPI